MRATSRLAHSSAIRVAAAVLGVWINLAGGAAWAQYATGTPLTAGDFQLAAPRGFGDRNNSEVQSMAWWNNHLFVGTDRESLCVSDFAIWDYITLTVSLSFANTYLPYPPTDPDLSCAPDGADLSIQAEIWSWDPASDTWARVYRSPLALNNPGPGLPIPAGYPVMWQGKKLPYEIGYRGMASFTEPNGTSALYVFGTNSDIMWDAAALPLPRILRTTDGVTFKPLPQAAGTFLGTLPFTSDHSSYRSPLSFAGRLFVLCGTVEGNGNLIASADPSKGNNAWFLASPPGMQFYELGVFNGWLYLGGFDLVNGVNYGYTVLKTRADGTPPYTLTTVIPAGAYLTTMPSDSVVSMREYHGRLYVGTDNFAEVIRLNADDTWDLVVGTPRAVPLPNGGSEMKYPLSGLDAGWGHTLNVHAWWMEEYDHSLYIGTYNAGTAARLSPGGSLLLPENGAHLYRSHDGGYYYTAVTTDGFASPSDPDGGIFDYGIRTITKTPYGLFLGTANDYFGLAVFQGLAGPQTAPAPVGRVEMEPLTNGNALLSWQAAAGAQQYQIWRAERNPIYIRSNLDVADYSVTNVEEIEDLNFTEGTSIHDIYIGPYQMVGVSQTNTFIDSTVQSGQPYMYYVIADGGGGNVSTQSNLVAFPLLTPSVTFAQLLNEVNVLLQRQRYQDPVEQLTLVTQMIVQAQSLAANCQIKAAHHELDPQAAFSEVLEPDATDLEILIGKLRRRLTLYKDFPGQVISTEFCTQPG